MSIKTPYYVFDRKKFCALINEYKAYGNLFLPIKANDDRLIISTIRDSNCGFEVDSIEHIHTLIQSGIPPDKLLYSYPVREQIDIKKALKLGVRLFVIDSHDEYVKIKNLSSEVKFVVRLNVLDIIENKLRPEQNKWGLSIQDAICLISVIRGDNNYLAGISFYITSEIRQEDAFEIILNAIASNFMNANVDFVNIGGGISIEKLKNLKISLDNVKSAVKAKYIILEPGRHLLNPCIDMTVSITTIRNINDNRLVFINAGIYSGLLDVIVKKKKYTIEDKNQTSSSTLVTSFICGSSSDISDTLGEYNLRANLAVGDTLIINECGAYSSVMQTYFYGKDRIDMILKDGEEDATDL